ncbi:MAG: ComEC/Rec2 family competence protein [Bacteroidales bacterium]
MGETYPLVRVVIPFYLGILLGNGDLHPGSGDLLQGNGDLLPGNEGILPGGGAAHAALLGCVLGLWYFMWPRRTRAYVLGWRVLVFGFFLLAGYANSSLNRPGNPGMPAGQQVLVRGIVGDDVQWDGERCRFDLEVGWTGARSGFSFAPHVVKVTCPWDTNGDLPVRGQTWQFPGRLFPFQSSRNPGETDYRAIFARKNCWYRLAADTSLQRFIRELPGPRRPIWQAERVRGAIARPFVRPGPERSLLLALALGDRASMPEELEETYVRAGSIHLLAVSGLHVGLLWWGLRHLLGLIPFLFRNPWSRTLVLLALLWYYAYLTGLSSSVCRSVLMLSLYSLAVLLRLRSAALNSTFGSAFILLLLDPGRGADVGFQLSYLAVLGILLLKPLLDLVLRSSRKVPDWIGNATSVSLSAQLGTLPLVLHYFGQVPLYALVSNLVALPLLMVLMGALFLSLPFSLAGVGTAASTGVLYALARLMNRSMAFFAGLPHAVAEDVSPGGPALGFLALAVLFLFAGALQRTRRPFYGVCVCLVCCLGSMELRRTEAFRGCELRISHLAGGNLVSFREGNRVDHYVLTKDSTAEARSQRIIREGWNPRLYANTILPLSDSLSQRGSASVAVTLSPGRWLLGNDVHSVLLLQHGSDGQDSMIRRLDPDVVLFSGEPFPFFRPPGDEDVRYRMVGDGSTRSWYLDRMESGGVHIHRTDLHGALRMSGQKNPESVP